ncbi:protein CHAPERONE-LIKE PROTEIN OF POR1, chloroplastic [Macadamia integrifolia]|uniref:protein CHAPERONE-LIKE PROTEIN OF POR1, chloroplastic n=1 Tax=Macadamia integrifolia TaxID=60698 RepID=UPI001C4FCBB4|nr:protein CHAPERONE-LIKE PROTEIN OF POR1, chloroplastic [Macadamia integrifolia]XP_042485384.1 protein CHAPERONE-LIKE PROTEIN OF POR1, chloroplastic [Macadamia integrifolia]
MSVTGLTCNSSRFSFYIPKRGSGHLFGQVSAFPHHQNSRKKMQPLRFDRHYWIGFTEKNEVLQSHSIYNAMGASFGDSADNSPDAVVFPRINIRDPYKRLGISSEASEDEIQAARNFLIHKYARHQPSIDAIESAHNKIIMQKFYERKNPKINIKKKVRELTQSRVVQAVMSRFQTPSTNFIIKTAIAFAILGAVTVLFPTEDGPTLQVAISLIATVYFIYDRLKNRVRAILYSIGAFIVSWLLGTFLMVSVVPPILRGPRSLEVSTSLITYILLWVSSTYLK